MNICQWQVMIVSNILVFLGLALPVYVALLMITHITYHQQTNFVGLFVQSSRSVIHNDSNCPMFLGGWGKSLLQKEGSLHFPILMG